MIRQLLASEQHTLTPAEAAAYLRVHKNTILNHFNRGKLPGIRLGRKVLLSREGLERMLNAKSG